MSTPRGIRNNNPGNIRTSSSNWKGKIVPSQDSAFEQFESMPFGIRALALLLITYNIKYNLQSLEEILSRYAPKSENDTQAYVNYLKRFSPDRPNLKNPEEFKNLIRGIINFENGEKAAEAVTDQDIIKGLELAGVIDEKKKCSE
jgi:hypothetical protein